MKPSVPGELVAHALAATWGFIVLSSQGIVLFAGAALDRAQELSHPPISTETAIVVSAVFGSVGAMIAALNSKGGVKERVATGLASIGFAVAGGPLTAQIIIAQMHITNGPSVQIVMGAAFALALMGWPFYRFILAMFIAGDKNASGIGRFIGEVGRAYFRRKD